MRSYINRGQENFYNSLKEKIKDDKDKIYQFDIWMHVNGQLQIVDELVRENFGLIRLDRDLYKHELARLVMLFSRWQSITEKINLLTTQPVTLTEHQEMVYELYNYAALRETYKKFEIFLITLEKAGGELYESRINEGLQEGINELQKTLVVTNDDIKDKRFESSYLHTELNEALQSIARIQKTKNKESNKYRLQKVDYKNYYTQLKKIEEQMDKIFKKKRGRELVAKV